jgi:small-conductance mechanosensitive channel
MPRPRYHSHGPAPTSDLTIRPQTKGGHDVGGGSGMEIVTTRRMWLALAGANQVRMRSASRAMLAAGLAALVFAFATMAHAQDDARTVAVDPRHELAMVEADGDDLYIVAGLSGLPAERRAQRIADRIVDIASASNQPPVLDIRDTEYGPGIYIDNVRIDVVTQMDLDIEDIQDDDGLAVFRGRLILDAIERYRERRTDQAIGRSIILALAWTVAFVAYSVALAVLNRLFMRRANRRIERWVKVVEEKTGKLAETDVIVSVIRLTLWIVAFLLFFVALYYYLSQVLLSFPASRGIAKGLLGFFTEPLVSLALGAVGLIPNLLALAVIYFLTRYILKIVRLVFVNIELGVIKIHGFEITWTWPSYRIIRVVIIIFAVIVAYPYIPGSGTAAFQGISIFLGVVLSLGSSSVISNVFAGLFVIYRRSVNVGDLIEVRGYTGRVESIVLQETLLRSPKNELVSVPNALLLSSELRNFSRPGPAGNVMISTQVGIGYEEPQRKIEAMLLEAASRTGGLRSSPAPFVLRSELADFAVVYEMRVSPQTVNGLAQLRSDLHANILDVFNERGVQIMTPAYVGDPSEPKIATVEVAPSDPDPGAPKAARET